MEKLIMTIEDRRDRVAALVGLGIPAEETCVKALRADEDPIDDLILIFGKDVYQAAQDQIVEADSAERELLAEVAAKATADERKRKSKKLPADPCRPMIERISQGMLDHAAALYLSDPDYGKFGMPETHSEFLDWRVHPPGSAHAGKVMGTCGSSAYDERGIKRNVSIRDDQNTDSRAS